MDTLIFVDTQRCGFYFRVNPLSLVEIILHVVRQMTGESHFVS